MVLTKKVFCLFGLLAVLLTSVAPGASVCEMTAHPAEGDCRTEGDGALTLAGQDETESPPAENCCTTGCRDCTLPCCAGPALMLAQAPTQTDPAAVLKALTRLNVRCPQVDAEPQFRPPQA
jgi:hypothetical protein